MHQKANLVYGAPLNCHVFLYNSRLFRCCADIKLPVHKIDCLYITGCGKLSEQLIILPEYIGHTNSDLPNLNFVSLSQFYSADP